MCLQVRTPLTLDSVHDFDMGKLLAITINANAAWLGEGAEIYLRLKIQLAML